MNGPNEIRNINTQRAQDALVELQAKAEAAQAQGHPRADEFAARAEALNAELNGSKESN
jgi:hypothetical protein